MKVVVNILHWGMGGLLILLGLITAAGIHLPGVSVNPDTAIPAGLGVWAAGLKSSVWYDGTDK